MKKDGNDMGLSKLCKQCRVCRYADTCDHKRMEALAYIPQSIAAQATMPMMQDIAMPLLQKHDYRDIKIAEGTTITIDIEELKQRLEKSYYPNLIQFGG